MSKLSRDRGQSYEREICTALSDHLGITIRRQLGQERDGGGDIRTGRFLLECKRRRRLGGPYTWMAQATAAAKPGETPAVIARADGGESLVILRLHDFLRLAREELA